MTTNVESRPCKTCGEPANYIGTSATGTAFACPACAGTSWYYDDEPVSLASCGHPRDEDGECGCAWWPERAPVDVHPTDELQAAADLATGWGPARVSMALAEHTAHALNTLSGTLTADEVKFIERDGPAHLDAIQAIIDGATR